jgi:sensor histidine kinase YesM
MSPSHTPSPPLHSSSSFFINSVHPILNCKPQIAPLGSRLYFHQKNATFGIQYNFMNIYKLTSGSLIVNGLKIIGSNLLLATAIVALMCPACMLNWDRRIDILWSILYSFFLCITLGYGNNYLVAKIDSKVSWIETPVKRLAIGAFALLFYSFLISVVVMLLFNVVIFKSFTLNQITWQLTLRTTAVPVAIAVAITIFLTSRSFLKEWKQSVVDAEKYKRETLQARYDALMSQVNPHFLFNSFNVLTDLVYVDQDLAAKFIQQLSKVYRYVLESSNKEFVPLTTEIEFLRAYVFLLQIRFGNNLQVSWPDSIPEHYKVVPLCLQLLIENAIKHNVVSQEEPLHITISLEKEMIEVSNTLQRRNVVEHSTGMGLANIKSRYEHLGTRQVLINETHNSFSVQIPLLKSAPVYERIDH